MNLQGKIDKIINFEGPIVANATSFHEDGSVNYAIEKFADYLSKVGVCGVYLHGTTGEGISLSSEEKKQLNKTWQGILLKKFSKWLAIFNVSATCVQETIDQARHCEKIGVDAIAVLPPFYYRPASDEELISYLKSIASEAPNTPLIYYHFPNMTQVNIRLKEFVAKAQAEIPQFVGMKYTCTDMVDLSRFVCQDNVNATKKFKIFAGYEQSITPMAGLGIKAAICASFNFAGPVTWYSQIRENFSKDLSVAIINQGKLNAFCEDISTGGSFIRNVKDKLNRVFAENKLDISVGNPRSPIMG